MILLVFKTEKFIKIYILSDNRLISILFQGYRSAVDDAAVPVFLLLNCIRKILKKKLTFHLGVCGIFNSGREKRM